MGADLSESVLTWMPILALEYLASNLLLTYYINPTHVLLPFIGLCVGILLWLLPLDRLFTKAAVAVIDPNDISERILPGYYDDYEKAAPTFFEDFERMNPATSSQGWKNWLDLVQAGTHTGLVTKPLEEDSEDEDASVLATHRLSAIYQRLSDLKMM